jgi:hypothetical protein
MASWGFVLLLLFPPALAAQQGPGLQSPEQRRDAILEADHKKSLRDVAEIRRLVQELEEELEKNEVHIIDVRTMRKAERIEELAKNIRNRMRRVF